MISTAQRACAMLETTKMPACVPVAPVSMFRATVAPAISSATSHHSRCGESPNNSIDTPAAGQTRLRICPSGIVVRPRTPSAK